MRKIKSGSGYKYLGSIVVVNEHLFLKCVNIFTL
ncbi:hypothetical protein Q5A_004345 [Serratia inhibens PRI-2C]|nr:hypothetical protein Q5A_004345 [Serratia inhibens PRI-2C]